MDYTQANVSDSKAIIPLLTTKTKFNFKIHKAYNLD